ncbi:MAG: hypothetical protein NUW00_00825 [Candidatus Kaiserbacteria bacterium]|nr:hypothetical protein [Candidatus Kaiserbacteria bacterium]
MEYQEAFVLETGELGLIVDKYRDTVTLLFTDLRRQRFNISYIQILGRP